VSGSQIGDFGWSLATTELRLAASGQIKLRVLDGYRDLKEVKKAA
jgi:hypothetical protein